MHKSQDGLISLPEQVVDATRLDLSIISCGETAQSERALARAVRHLVLASGVCVHVYGSVLRVRQCFPEGSLARVGVGTKVSSD